MSVTISGSTCVHRVLRNFFLFDVKAAPPVDTREIDEGLRPAFEPGKLVSSTSKIFIPATHSNDEQEIFVLGFAFKSKNVWCLTCFTVQTSFGMIVHSGSGFNLEEREIELGKYFNIIKIELGKYFNIIIMSSRCATYLGTRVVLCLQWVLWKPILTTSKGINQIERTAIADSPRGHPCHLSRFLCFILLALLRNTTNESASTNRLNRTIN